MNKSILKLIKSQIKEDVLLGIELLKTLSEDEIISFFEEFGVKDESANFIHVPFNAEGIAGSRVYYRVKDDFYFNYSRTRIYLENSKQVGIYLEYQAYIISDIPFKKS